MEGLIDQKERARQDSNLHLGSANRLFCPLNYGHAAEVTVRCNYTVLPSAILGNGVNTASDISRGSASFSSDRDTPSGPSGTQKAWLTSFD